MEPCYVSENGYHGDRGLNSPLIIKPYHDTSSSASSSSSPWRGPQPSANMYHNNFPDLDHIMAYPNTGATYKDLIRERGQEVTDTLITLKPIVNPTHSNQLSPIPASLGHISQTSGHLSTGSMTSPSAFPYAQTPAVVGNSALVPGYHHGFTSPQGNQYPNPQYQDQIAPNNVSPGSHMYAGPPSMFPSMSVNVSMSMNVGVPGAGPAPDGFFPGEQWSSSPHHPHHHHHPAAAAGQYSPVTAQTLPYSLQHPQYMPATNPSTGNQHYPASYSFSTDLKSPQNSYSPKEMMYKPSPSIDYRAVSKFYHSFSALHMRNRKSSTSSRSGSESSKINLCRICGKTYARPSTLKTHMRTHSGEKPYRCPTCNKSFSQAANLTAHVRTHSGEKPFRCPVCERRFSQSSSVTTHMRTHSGERPYRCRMCKKAFSDSSTLTKHLRIHSGEKPYQCKLCLLRFSQSGNLNRHMRVHSNNV